MSDDGYDVLRLGISFENFFRLPRNPAYKYEYYGGKAVLTPRPKGYSALLELAPRTPPEPLDDEGPIHVRPLVESDWERLPELFSAAFEQVAPFVTLADDRRLEVSRIALRKTRDGNDGPPVPSACLVAHDENRDSLLGAALVTRPNRYLDEATMALGPPGSVAHLTWIFVAPQITRYGIGSMLLAGVVNALLALGDRHLASTFLLGNESSTLWHWSAGFRLLPYFGSHRNLNARFRRRQKAAGSLEIRPDDPDGPPEGSS